MSESVRNGEVLYALKRLVNLMEFDPPFHNNIRFVSRTVGLPNTANPIMEMDIAQIIKIPEYVSVKVETIAIQFGFALINNTDDVKTVENAYNMFNMQWFKAKLKCLSGDPLDSTLRLCIEDNETEYPIIGIKMNNGKSSWRHVYTRISAGTRMDALIKDGVLEISLGPVVLSVGQRSSFDWYDALGVKPDRRYLESGPNIPL